MTKNAKLSAFPDVASDNTNRTSSLDAIFGGPEAFATPCPSGSDDPSTRPEPHLERENYWRRARTNRIAARNPKGQRALGSYTGMGVVLAS